MEAKEKTPNHQPDTFSDREFLEGLALMMSGIVDNVDRLMNDSGLHTQYLVSLDERTAVHSKQLDHLDGMLHEVHQFIEEHRPALAKALAFLDPGKSMRDFLRDRRNIRKDPKE